MAELDAHRRRPRPDPRARARRRGRRVVHEVVRLPDHDDRRQGARSWHRREHEHGSGGRAPVRARRLALDELGRGRVAGLDRRRRRRPARPAPSCSSWAGPLGASHERVVLCGMGGSSLAPLVIGELHGSRPPARARLDRPRRRARRAGRGLALRDRLQVGLDDRAQLLRRRVLGQDRRRRLALRRDHRPRLGARGARAQATAGRASRTGAPTSAAATPRSPRSGSCRPCSRASTSAPLLRARRRARSRSATTSSASTRARRSRT